MSLRLRHTPHIFPPVLPLPRASNPTFNPVKTFEREGLPSELLSPNSDPSRSIQLKSVDWLSSTQGSGAAAGRGWVSPTPDQPSFSPVGLRARQAPRLAGLGHPYRQSEDDPECGTTPSSISCGRNPKPQLPEIIWSPVCAPKS